MSEITQFYGFDQPDPNPQIKGPQMVTLRGLEKFGCPAGHPDITLTITATADSTELTVQVVSNTLTAQYFTVELVDVEGNEFFVHTDDLDNEAFDESEVIALADSPNLNEPIYVRLSGATTGNCECRYSEQFKLTLNVTEAD
jgi:hypothetical protein